MIVHNGANIYLVLGAIRAKIKSQEFLVNKLSIFVNPVYILRRGLLEAIELNSDLVTGDVLDFGCGSKPYETLFKNTQSYIGVEMQFSGHDHSESSIDCFYDGKLLPFRDDSFDTIVSFEVFEHVFNLEYILLDIHRVLRPNGHLLISTPFCWGEHEEPFDFARFTSFGMRSILERSSFRVLSIQKTNDSFLAVSQMLISYIANGLPKGRVLGPFLQLLVIFPLNLLTVFLGKLLPKRFDSFSNLVVFAERI